jgi:pSer/pThr/pTyr-binding forkhead associated (FHA) protein
MNQSSSAGHLHENGSEQHGGESESESKKTSGFSSLTPRVQPPSDPHPEEIIYTPTPSGARPMTLIVEKLNFEIEVPRDRPSVLIGREDPENDVYPDIDTTSFGGADEGVSRTHARIILKGNQYFVEDLDSINSTYVNKIRITAHQLLPLNDDDILCLGRLNFRIKLL